MTIFQMVDIPSYFNRIDFWAMLLPGYIAVILAIVLFYPTMMSDMSDENSMPVDILSVVLFVVAGPAVGFVLQQIHSIFFILKAGLFQIKNRQEFWADKKKLEKKKKEGMERLNKKKDVMEPLKYEEEVNRLKSYKAGFRFKRDYALLRVRCNDTERLEMDNAEARFSFNISTGLALVILAFASYLFLPELTIEQFNIGPPEISRVLISVSIILFTSAILGDFYNVHVPVIMELFKKYNIPCPYCPKHSLLAEVIEDHIKKVHADKNETCKKAIELYDQRLVANQYDANTWSNKGSALVLLKRYDEAMKCFDKAIMLNPNHLQSRIDRAICLGFLGRKEQSMSDFNYAKCLI